MSLYRVLVFPPFTAAAATEKRRERESQLLRPQQVDPSRVVRAREGDLCFRVFILPLSTLTNRGPTPLSVVSVSLSHSRFSPYILSALFGISNLAAILRITTAALVIT